MNTQIKTIKGFRGGAGTGCLPQAKDITVRFTSDRNGETISLEDGETMLGVPFEKVARLIEKARRAGKGGRK